MASIEAHLLFEMDMQMTGAQVVGVVPDGLRDIVTVQGSFEGQALKGTIESGADWGRLRSDNTPEMDARMTLKTDDGETIYLHYTGLGEIPDAALKAAKPGDIPGGVWKLTVAMRFETASKKYAMLNRIQGIGIGSADVSKGTVSYKVYTPA
ncbi:MAG TPA: DUF3237 domain-containing protein [Candidatus Binataceae bacterium]|nr:DUF3237 domain-containing protein [Candidatus Binataceae bacterium]